MVHEMNEERHGKIAVLGNRGVGKTALIVRCLTRRFLPEYAPCSETVYRYKGVKDGRNFETVIVDSDGKNNDLYPTMEAFILVYSVTSRRSLQTIESFIKKVNVLNRQEPIKILIGNQTDLVQKREVSSMEGSHYAATIGAEYYEVSAANEVQQIVDIFNDICYRIHAKKKKPQKLKDMFKRRGST